MYQSMYEEYLETEVLTAEPIQLVQLMYRAAVNAIGGARAALAVGDIPARSRLISKASAILNELALSLDHSQNPALCRSLVELYDYMLRRLIEANSQQIEAPLVEVEGLLRDVLSAWTQAGQKQGAERSGFSVPAYSADPDGGRQRVSYAY